MWARHRVGASCDSALTHDHAALFWKAGLGFMRRYILMSEGPYVCLTAWWNLIVGMGHAHARVYGWRSKDRQPVGSVSAFYFVFDSVAGELLGIRVPWLGMLGLHVLPCPALCGSSGFELVSLCLQSKRVCLLSHLPDP